MPRVRGVGIGVVGLGWMGQAHSRSYRRIPALFPDRVAEPELVLCADPGLAGVTPPSPTSASRPQPTTGAGSSSTLASTSW